MILVPWGNANPTWGGDQEETQLPEDSIAGQDLVGLISSLLVLLGPTWVIPWYQEIEYGIPTLQIGKKQIACKIIKVIDQGEEG